MTKLNPRVFTLAGVAGAVMLCLLAVPRLAIGEQAILKACTDRVIVGGLDSGKKPLVVFVEFHRLLSDDGNTRLSYRVWLSRNGKLRLAAEEAWTGKGDPCEFQSGKQIRASKPDGTHFQLDIKTEGAGEIYIATMAPRNGGSKAFPIGKGFVRFSAVSAMVKLDGTFIRTGAAWMEAEYDWKDSQSVPNEWSMALTPELEMWLFVDGKGKMNFSSFTDEAGETRFGRNQSYLETSSEMEPDSTIPFPRTAIHTLPWAKSKIELQYTQKWLEPSGTDKANALLTGHGNCHDPFKHLHTLTSAAWIRQRGELPGKKKK